MRLSGFWRPWTRAGLIGCALAAGTTAVTSVTSVGPAGAGALPAVRSAVSGHVLSIPAPGTPQLAKRGSTEQVRQLAECDGLMYAVGAFTAIEWGGKTYSRHNVFSFSATAPYQVTSWNPDANGEVNSIALAPDCRHAWLGGSFTTVAVLTWAMLSTGVPATVVKLPPSQAWRQSGASAIELTSPLASGFHEVTW